MTTQTIQFESVSLSEIGSGTITAFLFSGSTLAATLASIEENGTLKGRYTGTVEGIAAADYRLVVKFDGYTVSEPDETVTLLLAVGTYVSNRLAVLDSATNTQIDNIETSVSSLGSQSTTVERSISDTNTITFAWPVSGATITGTRSLNNGVYGAVTGTIAFLRTETGRHYYTLAYNAADRPVAEGQVRYKFVDGTYTGYVVLRTVNLVTEAQVNAQVLDVLSVDTFAELAAPPAATSSLKDKITWLFMWLRNKGTATATQRKLYADDGTTVVSTETITDDGTTFTKGEAS